MEFGILSKIYDAIEAIPKTPGAMAVGTFKEKAINMTSTQNITNCVFSIEGKGKLYAAWLAGWCGTSMPLYRWGLKVVIDDEVVFDVQKKSNTESYYDDVSTIGFITSALYSSGVHTVCADTSDVGKIGYGKIIPFVTPNGCNHGVKCLAPFSNTGGRANHGGYASNAEFVDGVANGRSVFMCVIPDKQCTSYTLSGQSGTNGTQITVSSIIPEPLVFNKNVKIYVSNKLCDSGSISPAARIAYTLES